jgi:hypothetical protein
MRQEIKNAIDNMLQKLRGINLDSEAARLKVIEGIEAILKDYSQEAKEKVFEKVETLLNK